MPSERTPALAALVLLISFAAAAQVRETVSVSVVEVPVTVVDSAGNPLRGLTAKNFKLYDQGKERAITSFDTIDLTALPSDALAPVNPAARRSFLVLFDLMNSQPESLARAQDAARNFVTKSVLPRDFVAVGTIDAEHGFHLLTSFTADRELIALAIGNPRAFTSVDPLQLAGETKIATVDSSGRELAALVNGPLGMGEQAPQMTRRSDSGELTPKQARIARLEEQAIDAVDSTRQMSHANEAYSRMRIEKEIDALGEMAKLLRGVPGRKQIVLLSEGFDASLVSGRDARAGTETKNENEYALRGDTSRLYNEQRFGDTKSQGLVNQMVKYFHGSDVVLNAIDIQGLRVQNDLGGARINSNAGLGMLASPTGGLVFQNANNIDDNFTRMMHAQEVVYVLAFQPQTTRPGTFHNLEVKLAGVKSGAHVTARGGYYEGGNESAQERMLGIASIILNDVPQDGVHLNAFVAPFPNGDGNAQVPVILDIFGGDVVRGARTPKTPIEIYVYAFDDKGVVRDRIYQRMSIDTDRLREKLYDTGVKFYTTLSLGPGRYAIKSLVRMPESEHKGFARADVAVPERGSFALLPPVFIDAASRWVMVKGTSHAANAPYPFHLDQTVFVPAAAARVRSGETPQFALFVQNAEPDEVTIETRPQAKLIGSARGDGTSIFLLQLDDVAASVATLDITMHKKGVAQAQTVSVRLEP